MVFVYALRAQRACSMSRQRSSPSGSWPPTLAAQTPTHRRDRRGTLMRPGQQSAHQLARTPPQPLCRRGSLAAGFFTRLRVLKTHSRVSRAMLSSYRLMEGHRRDAGTGTRHHLHAGMGRRTTRSNHAEEVAGRRTYRIRIPTNRESPSLPSRSCSRRPSHLRGREPARCSGRHRRHKSPERSWPRCSYADHRCRPRSS